MRKEPWEFSHFLTIEKCKLRAVDSPARQGWEVGEAEEEENDTEMLSHNVQHQLCLKEKFS